MTTRYINTTTSTVVEGNIDKPLLNEFLLKYDAFCIENQLPSLNNCPKDDYELFDLILSKSYTFVEEYINTKLYTREKQNDIITEFGMKKLIDLKCGFDGEKICNELLDFDNHIEDWVHFMLMNFTNVY